MTVYFRHLSDRSVQLFGQQFSGRMEQLRNYLAFSESEESLRLLKVLERDIQNGRVTRVGQYKRRMAQVKLSKSHADEILASGMEQWKVTDWRLKHYSWEDKVMMSERQRRCHIDYDYKLELKLIREGGEDQNEQWLNLGSSDETTNGDIRYQLDVCLKEINSDLLPPDCEASMEEEAKSEIMDDDDDSGE